MTYYYVHTITDTITGEITRYVIAEDGVTLGLDISETVSSRKPLTDYFGTNFPVEIVTRRPLASASIRIQIEGLREQMGKAALVLPPPQVLVALGAIKSPCSQ